MAKGSLIRESRMTTETINDAAIVEAEILMVWSVSIDCPHCRASQDGWLADPRGKDHECDDCGKRYRVPADIRVVF